MTEKEEIKKKMRYVARTVKRQRTMKHKREELDKLPNPPVMLSLSQLSKKTGMAYSSLHRMIVEEEQIPYIKVGKTFKVNYKVFLDFLNREV